MNKADKESLESLLKRMVDDGYDMSKYRMRSSPNKLIVPPSLLMAAQEIYAKHDRKDYIEEIDFGE